MDLIEEFKKLKQDEIYVKTLCKKISLMKHNEAKEISLQIITFVTENKLEYSYPWVINSLAWSEFYLMNFIDATKLARESYEIFVENKDTEGILIVTNTLMAIYAVQQIFYLAIEIGIDGIKLAEQIGDYERVSAIKSILAAVYIDMEEYEKGKELLEQLESLSYMGNGKLEVNNYINRTICEIEMNNLDTAMEYVDEAYRLAKIYIQNAIPEVLKEKASIYIKKGMYEIAEKTLIESLKLSRRVGNNLHWADTLLCMGELDLAQGSYEKCIKKTLKVLESIDKVNSRRELKRVYLNINKAYKGLGDYEKAYFYLEKYMELQKYISDTRNNLSISILDKKKEEEEKKIYKLLYKQIEKLYSIGQRITANLDKEDIFNIIAKEIELLIKLDIFQLGIYIEEENTIQYQLCLEAGKRIELGSIIVMEDTFSGYSFKHNKDILINDVEKESHIYVDKLDDYINRIEKKQIKRTNEIPKSLMFVPINVNNKITGIISTQCFEKNSYNLKDLNTLKILSTYIGIALENSRLYKKVQYSANYDSLTSILNRREALIRLENIHVNRESNNVICLMMIDADNFKNINDVYGHQVGDKVLIEISRKLRTSVNEADIVGRYGGEEFIVAIKHNNNRDCNEIGEEIRRNIENINVKSEFGEKIRVTVSIGIVEMEVDYKTMGQMINLADKALYEAKNTGKNKVVMYKIEKDIK